MSSIPTKYKFAISFATPQSDYACVIYNLLERKRLKTFIYQNERERMAASWMPGEYESVFLHEAERSIILLSKEYIEEKRMYTRIESRAAIVAMHQRLAQGVQSPLFVISFDKGVALPGYSSEYNYFNPHTETPTQIVDVIAKIVRGKKKELRQ